MNKKQYRKYLKSKVWRDIRKKLFKLRGKRCEICGKKTKLHVHHLTYERVGGDELPEDLKILCEFHHNVEHGMSLKKQKRYIAREKRRKRRNKKRKKEINYDKPCWHYID